MPWKSLLRFFKKPYKPVLPTGFPPGTSFAVYMRLPLTRDASGCKAWDVQGGRWLDPRLFETRALPCGEQEFFQALATWWEKERPRVFYWDEWLPIDLPDRFPDGTLFVDREGLPIACQGSVHGPWCAWSRAGGDWYGGREASARSAWGATEAEFRAVVVQRNETDYREQQQDSEEEGSLYPFQFIYRCDQLRIGEEYASDVPRDIHQYLVPFLEAAHCIGSPKPLSDAISDWLENRYLKAWLHARRELYVPALRWAMEHPDKDYRALLPKSLKAPCSNEECVKLLAICLQKLELESVEV